ncbi:M23 family metallopeptidase [Aurantimonas sp. 22II-16-19i]|uniref:M23 family metallopeptidase n=1 Tax=Aurantimonas sp. 22II-16-19i TaxID=1317114 RepID=UPI001FDAC967|nr:M23 family metallopeptidase [Aurantimonas sp. 22II-16-19i]
MQASKLTSTFGRRKEPHTVIIAQGERVRHFTVGRGSLILAAAVTVLVAASAITMPLGYVLSAPEETGAAGRPWDGQDDYERRIATLRAELDRATSRQFLARKMVESKVDVLLEQQEQLAARYEKLQPLFDRATSTGLLVAAVPVPTPKPESDDLSGHDTGPASDSVEIAGDAEIDAIDAIPGESGAPAPSDPAPAPAANAFAPDDGAATADWLGRLRAEVAPQARAVPVAAAAQPARAGGRTGAVISDESLRQIGAAISVAELAQLRNLEALASTARGRAVQISTALASAGIAVADISGEASDQEGATGGPYEPVPASDAFEASVAELDAALDQLQRVSAVARELPFERPMPGSRVTSTFGVRADPFLGRKALHAGIDFAEAQGTAIHATAPGTVTKAGNFGGYGNMVEIDHGNGISTRYGHMARVTVDVGQTVGRGATIGAVGSTGRSTGPHLHYEVRRDGVAVDPAKFFRIGDRIRAFG